MAKKKLYLKGLSGEGAKKGANYGKGGGRQTSSRKQEGRVRKKEAKKITAKKQAVKYPRDPGARAQLKGKQKRKATREARRQNNTETEKQKQRQRTAAFKQLLRGDRRFKTRKELDIENQTVVPYAPKKRSNDIRDITKDQREEQRKAIPKKKPSWLSQIASEAWKLKKGADVLTNPFVAVTTRIVAPSAAKAGKRAIKSSNTKPGQPTSIKTMGITDGVLSDAWDATQSVVKDAAHVVDATARPSYAISAGTGAGLKGENVAKGVAKGFTGKERGGFAKVLKEQGAPKKWYTDLAGLGLDIVLDPTTYVTAGAAPVATKAGNKAAAKVSKQIGKEGSETVARRLGLPLGTSRDDIMRHVRERVERETAEKIGHNKKGIQVGLATKRTRGISTSGRTTSKINQKTGGSAAATKIRENKVVDTLGRIFAPDWRRKGVSPKAHRESRIAVTRARGTMDKGTAEGARLQRAAHKAGLDEDTFFDLERGVDNTKTQALRQLMERDFERKNAAGILDEPWTPGRLPKAERQRIKDLHTTALNKARAELEQQKLVLQTARAEKAEAKAAGNIEAFNDAQGVFARAEQRIENLDDTIDRLKTMTIERAPTEDWEQYVHRLIYQTKQTAPDLSAYAQELRKAQKLGPKAYIPHVANKNIEPIEDVTTYVARPGTTTAGKEHERAIMYSIENARKTSPLAQVPGDSKSFSTDPGNILRYMTQRTSVNTALAEQWDHVKKHAGRAVKKGEDLTQIPDDYAVFAIGKSHPGHISAPIHNDDVAQLAAISEKPADYVILPTALVDQMKRALRPSTLRRQPGGKELEKVSGGLKAIYTKWNIPSHHTVNQIGDILFAQQAGTRVFKGTKDAALLKRAHLARNKAEQSGKFFEGADLTPEILNKPLKVGDVEQSLGDWLDEIEQFDILTQGHVGREITELTGKQTWFNRFLAGREDMMRLATYTQARGKGMLPEDAAFHVSKHHINYNDLTEFERALRSLPIPFITFLARNTRIQMSQLFQRPGKFATVAKSLNAAARMSGYESYMDFYDSLDDYQQTALLLPVGKDKKPINLQLPIDLGLDLASLNLDRAAETVLNGLFMPFKAIIELKQNKQIFNDREIVPEVPYSGGKKKGGLVPTGPAIGTPLDWLGVAQKNAKGTYVIPARLQYLLGQTPQTSALGRAGHNESGGRSWLDTLLSVGGIKKQPAPDSKRVVKDKSYTKQEKLGTAYERAKELYGENDPRTIAAKKKYNEAKKQNRPPTKKSSGDDPLPSLGSGSSGYGGI